MRNKNPCRHVVPVLDLVPKTQGSPRCAIILLCLACTYSKHVPAQTIQQLMSHCATHQIQNHVDVQFVGQEAVRYGTPLLYCCGAANLKKNTGSTCRGLYEFLLIRRWTPSLVMITYGTDDWTTRLQMAVQTAKKIAKIVEEIYVDSKRRHSPSTFSVLHTVL